MHYNLVSDLAKNQSLDIQDRGLHYGDGLFETMLLSNGQIKYWSEHYSRLSSSAEQLFMGCPEKSWFEQNLKPYFELNQRLIIKIILTRGSGGRGLNLPDDIANNVYILKYPVHNNSTNQLVKVCFSPVTLPVNGNLAGLKHLNRLDYVLATEALKNRAEFNEALLLDSNGYIVESIVNNVFFVKNDIVYTPKLDTSGVKGIMRQLVLKKLKQTKKEVKIGTYSKSDMLSADECFLSNSVQGIRPVIQIEDVTFNIGRITKDLQKIFHGHSGN